MRNLFQSVGCISAYPCLYGFCTALAFPASCFQFCDSEVIFSLLSPVSGLHRPRFAVHSKAPTLFVTVFLYSIIFEYCNLWAWRCQPLFVCFSQIFWDLLAVGHKEEMSIKFAACIPHIAMCAMMVQPASPPALRFSPQARRCQADFSCVSSL